MADLKTLCIDGECRNIPQGGGDVTGVKGQQETDYRTGDVNLTPNNILFLGTNPTGGTANDTATFWRGKGTGYAFFNATNQVNGQPSQWGFIESLVGSNEINQIWRGQDNKVYIRKANASTTAMPSWTPIDTDTKYTAGDNLTLTGTEFALKSSPALKGTPTAPTNGTASTSNTQIATTAFVQNAINRRVPKGNERLYAIGDNTAVPNNSPVFKDLITVPRKGWVVGTAVVQFPSNANGIRSLQIYTKYNGTYGSTYEGSAMNVSAATGGQTILVCPFATIIENANDKMAVRLWQNSGQSLTVPTLRMRCFLFTD